MKTIPSFIACWPALLLASLPLLAQSAPPDAAARAASDPFVRGEAGPAVVEAQSAPKFVSICFETFSLDLADAAALRRRNLSDKELYAEITGRVAKEQAKQETFAVIRARSGQRGTLENISEQIFPTAYDRKAELKDESKSAPKPTPKPDPVPAPPPVQASQAGPALPIAMETRNVGFTMDIEPTIGENEQLVDLRMTPEFVTLADHVSWGQGVSKTDFPVFETQRLQSSYTLIAGQVQLLGTFSRPPVSKVDADSAHRIWFAFVTADVVRVVKE